MHDGVLTPSDFSHLDEWPTRALEDLKAAINHHLAERSLGMTEQQRIDRMKKDDPDPFQF